ncbi:MAG TPA: HAD family hydrolase [Vicinamibacterales bacterium]
MSRILSTCRTFVTGLVALAMLPAMVVAQAPKNPLPSWNDGPSKQAIVKFVSAAVTRGEAGFIAPADRIAVFDNDGTLWSEQPMYFQLAFALDRVKTLAPQHPEWKTTQPFKAVLDGDMKALGASGEKGLVELVMATHAGITTDEFATIVADWIRTARHPKYRKPYTELVFQPMLELLSYLRANGFKTFIVSGGGVEFMRVFSQRVYGIPPEQVVGSMIETEFQMKDGKPALMRLPKVDFIDDGPGKPVGINKFIGRRPVFAFGNSDGDQQMLEWTTAGSGPRFAGIVHHTDGDREVAYDRTSSFGKLDKAWDEATAKGWTVVDMKSEWKRVFTSDAPR